MSLVVITAMCVYAAEIVYTPDHRMSTQFSHTPKLDDIPARLSIIQLFRISVTTHTEPEPSHTFFSTVVPDPTDPARIT
ncbi:hypothetical protein CROQUDRAFT_106108 [Cronartium quercuum f. sp. fusiforme G11]|uniref:Uncharacterized protein n=1 Tax=Cronartium quercuum f. sp. fusiforme G11 TaxID=708437 RepID=A0A9P6NLT1_9BASI|nr:hypothetical protein CROQUDRAFT_102351 [Cronartium quercuum f. sp. fusiforme G11]KAG0147912.1 hypothetical protein CROQUDRAFT_106108 [Cronartium quercuum f. sp. fusiforme G11]